MIPTNFVIENINSNLAADDSIWGSIAPSALLRPVINNFVPHPGLDITDLTFATFTGSTPVLIPIAPQTVVLDNLSGRFGILLKEPVGGYKFVATAPVSPEEVVYGWAITDTGGTQLLFSDVLPAPVTIKDTGNFVEFTAKLGYIQTVPYGNLPPI